MRAEHRHDLDMTLDAPVGVAAPVPARARPHGGRGQNAPMKRSSHVFSASSISSTRLRGQRVLIKQLCSSIIFIQANETKRKKSSKPQYTSVSPSVLQCREWRSQSKQ